MSTRGARFDVVPSDWTSEVAYRRGADAAIGVAHDTADKQRVLGQIDAYMRHLVAELYAKMGADPAVILAPFSEMTRADWPAREGAAQAAIDASPIGPVWRAAIAPAWNDWQRFVEWYRNLDLDLGGWDDWQAWIDRVGKLHAYVESEIPKHTGADFQIDTPAPLVGASGLFGTGFGADVLGEIDGIDRDVDAMVAQMLNDVPVADRVALAQDAATPAMLADPRVAFYAHTWRPWVKKWNAFRDDKRSTKSKLVDFAKGPLLLRGDYFEAQKWRDELRALWDQAKAHGFHLGEIAPPAGDRSFGSAVAEGAKDVGSVLKDAGGTLWLLLRVALWGVAGLAGVFGIVLIVNEARSGRGVRR